MQENENGFPKKKSTKIYTVAQALLKGEAYCAYQERHQQEVRDKLYEWGLHKKDVEAVISELITNNFLNEERFAKAYAGGKFRIKKWGRVKIRIELQKRKLSEYCIKKGLQEFSEKEYLQTIRKLIAEKNKTVKEKNPLKQKYKVAQYLISRGFEGEVVWGLVD